MEMYYKQGILKSLESLSRKGGKNPHNSGLSGENNSFTAKKKKKQVKMLGRRNFCFPRIQHLGRAG